MPELGEVKRGLELGYCSNRQYIWRACERCGKEDWQQFNRGFPKYKYCHSCALVLSGHMARPMQQGAKNPVWKGGRTVTKQGYVLVYLPSDSFFFPMARSRGKYSGTVMEHRLVMAKHLGRCLGSWEIVHHKNGIKDDNRLENLELTIRGQHVSRHGKGYQDGFVKGYKDGKDKRIGVLEQRVTQLEAEVVLLCSQLTDHERIK